MIRMVDVNLTLVIQALNFGLSLIIFKKLLIDSSLVQINMDEAKRNKLRSDAEKVSRSISRKQQYCSTKLMEYKRILASESPSIHLDSSVLPHAGKKEKVDEPEVAEVSKLAKELEKSIVEAVDHVG